MLDKNYKYLLGKVDSTIHQISIPVMLLIIILYGGYFLLDSSYALAEEQKNYESEIKKEYLQLLEQRIWQLEERLEKNLQDIPTQEELRKLKEEKEKIEYRLEAYIEKGDYIIVAKHSGQCLDVKGKSPKKGANAQQWTCHGGDNQLFTIVPKGNGYYSIVAKHSGQCLDVKGKSTQKGANVQQWTCHGGDNQLWKIEKAGLAGH